MIMISIIKRPSPTIGQLLAKQNIDGTTNETSLVELDEAKIKNLYVLNKFIIADGFIVKGIFSRFPTIDIPDQFMYLFNLLKNLSSCKIYFVYFILIFGNRKTIKFFGYIDRFGVI